MEIRERVESLGLNYDEFVKEIVDTYNFYGHAAREEGVEKILKTVNENKGWLMDLFSKAEGYNGNLQIVKEVEFEVKPDEVLIRRAIDDFNSRIGLENLIIKYTNEEGLTKEEYLKKALDECPKFISFATLMENANDMKKIDLSNVYDARKRYIPSVHKWNDLCSASYQFRYNISAELTTGVANYLNDLYPKIEGVSHGIKVAAGQKTSRAFNKLYNMHGINSNNNSEYAKYFAEYSDLVSERKKKYKLVFSVNPLDYLKMSFGNTWASCHTIDKENIRRSEGSHYSGMYCGGTLSYMLDGVSFVVYVVPMEADTNHPDRTDKIYRNMFHFYNDNLIQGRIYPQGNDGSLDLYKKFRLLVQEELTKMLGIEYVESGSESTWVFKGSTVDDDYYCKTGAHYDDPANFHDCNISYMRRTGLRTEMTIGHAGICAWCGEEITNNSYISHDSCIYERKHPSTDRTQTTFTF